MAWLMVGGAAIGAGVGSYGHDNWDWSKDAIWQGAAVGGAAGGATGLATGAYGTGTTAVAGSGVGSAGSGVATIGGPGGIGSGVATTGGAGVPGALGGAGGAGKASMMGSALQLGGAGMNLANAYSSNAPSMVNKLELGKNATKMRNTVNTQIKGQYAKAGRGDVSDQAFGSISALKTQEGTRARTSRGILAKAQASMSNTNPNDRGDAAMGGAMVKGQMADAGERMEGLFAPTSTLNSFRKQELMNSIMSIQNMQNREANIGQFNYRGSLAQWGADQRIASNKGAALGGAASTIGRVYNNMATQDQYANATA